MDSESYAVVKIGGKQHRVSPGTRLQISRQAGEKGDKLTLGPVLAVGGKDGAKFDGLDKVTVSAKIVAQKKTKKVLIFKKKRRTGYTKKQGHRQQVTEILVEKINGA